MRAQGIRGVMAMRGLHVRSGEPWYDAFRTELLRFPADKHDDQVDALGLIGQVLDAETQVTLKPYGSGGGFPSQRGSWMAG